MSTEVSHPPKIGWCSEGEFSFVTKSKRTEKLFPLGPLGWKRYEGSEDEQVREMIQRAGRQFLEKVATVSATNQNPAVRLEEDLLPMLKNIETQVRASYQDIGVDDVQLMQIAVDTCLFLLVVFKMFCGNVLHFSPQHLLLNCLSLEGKERWLRSIFFVGNQIPFVMVHVLTESFSFLKDQREKIFSLNPPSHPLMLALFNFVTAGISLSPKPPAYDVMHCLRSVILGPEPSELRIWTGQSEQGTATQLSGEGYSFCPLPQICGVRGIKCEISGLGVKVYLPAVEINGKVFFELMATSLARYEAIHHFEQSEVGFYLNSLCRLIQSAEDVQLLRSAGVIQGVNVAPLLDVLRDNFYVPPYHFPAGNILDIQSCKPRFPIFWKCKRLIGRVVVINATVLLCAQLLQTLYSILAYYKQSSPSPN